MTKWEARIDLLERIMLKSSHFSTAGHSVKQKNLQSFILTLYPGSDLMTQQHMCRKVCCYTNQNICEKMKIFHVTFLIPFNTES